MSGNWTQRLTLGIACVALFAAVGGPGYAASKISGSKIKKNSISANRLTAAARASLKGNIGPQGVPGAQGPQGPSGTTAPGSVGSNEVADGSLRTADFAVATGSSTQDLGSLAAQTCTFANLGSPVGVLPTDHVIVTADVSPGGYGGLGGLIVTGQIDLIGTVTPKVCNVSAAAINPPSETFKYIVLR